MKKKNLLITGANGFIGSNLMNFFNNTRDYRVYGLVRKSSNLKRLEGKNYNLRFGAITEDISKELKDIDIVIHTAGKASDWGKYEDFYSTNVTGTLNILELSIKSGVKRFIHYSSTVVYGFKGYKNINEDTPFSPFRNNYCITKALAEKKLWEHRNKIELVVIRPSNVYGPGDYSFTYPLFKSLEKGLPGFVKGGKPITSPCYVKNLVDATFLAATVEQAAGLAFNITDGKDMPWIEFLKKASSLVGKNPPKLFVPAMPLMALARILEVLYRLAGSKKPPFLTPYRIAISSKDYSFSIERARKILGYIPRYSPDEGLKESFEWYKNLQEFS